MPPDDKQPLEIQPSAFEPLDQAAAPPPKRTNPLRWVLIVCGALFLLVMAFLLTARSLDVVVVAETTASTDVDGLAPPVGERYLVPPGSYAITAVAQGYPPLTEKVTEDTRDSQRVELVLKPLPGLLSIESDPPGARVLIDGEEVGTTPLSALPVEAGEHQLALELPRYLPLEQALEITGRQLPQDLTLTLDPAWAEVTINSQPEGADILIDGENAGKTPATVEILQGERQLMLQLAGFAPWEQTLELAAGQPEALGTVELQPAVGVLELASVHSGANVTLDGEFQGQTPLSLEVSPGRAHRLAVFKPGYRRYNGSVELPAAGRDSRTVSLKAQLGKVRFELAPPQAILRVNGKPRGRGSQTLSLPAFEHSVEIALEGHATVRRRVTPRPGLEQLVRVSLQTEQAARMARLKPEITTSLGQTLLLFKPEESAQSDFTMGASRREPGRRSNEVLHPVALRRMFYLSTTEVTNAQFRLYQADHKSGQVDGNSLNREHQPAVQVSWQQAASFCNWLSKREGLPPFYRETKGIISGYNPSATGYRLPSEAEWAWAARADGSDWLKFPWGDSFPPTVAVENYADNTSAYVTGRILNGYTDGHVTSATVASFGPNSKGLYDMGGNVAEWVHDVYGIPSANGATKTDPLGSQSGDNYVIRGARWAHSKIAALRLSYRDYGQAGRDDVGFRVARYAE